MKFDILNRKRTVLQEEEYFITEDMTQKDLERKTELKPVIEEAKQKKIAWKFRNGQLYLNGQLYREAGHQGNQVPGQAGYGAGNIATAAVGPAGAATQGDTAASNADGINTN